MGFKYCAQLAGSASVLGRIWETATFIVRHIQFTPRPDNMLLHTSQQVSYNLKTI